MKKTKLLAPILGIATLSSAVVPLIGCARKQVVLVNKVEITNTTTEVKIGTPIALTTKVLPENAANKTLDWTVTPSDKAHVDTTTPDSPKLVGDAAGKVKVKAKAKDGSGVESVEKEFDVQFVSISKVTINNTKTTIGIDNELELTASIEPADASNKQLEWTVPVGTTAAEIVTKEDGKTYLKGKVAGTVTVTATAKDGSGKSDSKDFTVYETTINLDKTSLFLAANGTATLNAIVNPTEEEGNVTWTSDDTSVATVTPSTGKTVTITIPASATIGSSATITATIGDKTATCTVNVIGTFENTSWELISNAASTFEASDQGEDAMKALCNNFSDVEYIETIDPSITDPNLKIEAHLANFIGKTHDVTINEQTHQVRVIGINHDRLSSSTIANPKYALFTFDMVTLLSDKDGNMLLSYLSGENIDYPNSDLRKNLNKLGSGTFKWYDSSKAETAETKSAFEMLPTELQSAIKKVNKKVAKYDTLSSSYVVSPDGYDDKLFALTMSELAQTPPAINPADPKWIEEGTAYKYWTDHNGDSYRKKKDVVNTPKQYPTYSSYWLSTPYTDFENKDYSYYVSNMGELAHRKNYKIGVSFAFCI